MKKHSDVIVIGSGMAGLFSSLLIAKSGKSVTLISSGFGSLSIGSGVVDLLGYVNGKIILDSPFQYIDELPEEHPYRLIGKENVQSAIDEFINIANKNGYNVKANSNGSNVEAVTVMGTLKPTFLSTQDCSIHDAKKVMVVGIDCIKDCQVGLIVTELKANKRLAGKEFSSVNIASPFGDTYRKMNCLDIARYIDTPTGYNYILNSLKDALPSDIDTILIPPVLAVDNHNEVLAKLKDALKVNIIEMASIPPGVGGLRIRKSLKDGISKLPISVIENAHVYKATVENGKCLSVTTAFVSNERTIDYEYSADSFVVATGGILGGGVVTTHDDIYEAIFKIPVDCPKDVTKRSEPSYFSNHAFAKAGVKVNNELKAIIDGKVLMDNVYFIGRALGGYDYAIEKSGYGVSIATAYHASQKIVRG